MYKILGHKENIVIKTKKIKENEGRYLYNIIFQNNLIINMWIIRLNLKLRVIESK